MKIAVILSDGTTSVVNSEDLDYLLRQKSIVAFKRSSGWVRVGYDPIRGSGSSVKYCGKERRKE